MTDLDVPYVHPPAPEEAADAVPHHHLSPWPLVAALAATVFVIGVVTHPAVAVMGAILILMTLIGWVREDTLRFPQGPDPLTAHTVGTKDTAWWGIYLFLATEVVLFGALFAVYFAAKADATVWPPADVHLPVFMTGVNTAILVSSGLVMHLGEMALKRGNRRGFLLGFGGAILLGATFLVIQAYEYVHLVQEGLTLGHSIFGSAFYILTGTHGVHVLGGLVFLTVVFVRGAKGQFDAKRHSGVTAAALYWHFVDVVWIILFAIVYLQVI